MKKRLQITSSYIRANLSERHCSFYLTGLLHGLFLSFLRSGFAKLGLLLLCLLTSSFITSAQYNLQWATPQFRSAGSSFEYVRASEVDANQNLIVLAQNGRRPEPLTTTLYKYNSQGKEVWRSVYNEGQNAVDELPIAMRLDANGNIYVLVQLEQDEMPTQSNLVKYSAAGQQLWSVNLRSNAGSIVRANDLQVNGSGAVFITGESEGALITQRINTNGSKAWEAVYGGASDGSGTSLELDNSGNVYVGGSGTTGSYDQDAILLKYSAATGTQLFDAQYDHQLNLNTDDYVRRVLVAPDGSVYVLLNTTPDSYMYYSNIILLKYGTDGKLAWNSTVGATTESQYMDAALTPNGDVVVLGREAKYRAISDYFMTRISQSGQKSWYKTFNVYEGNMLRETAPAQLAVNAQGQIAVTGYTAYFQIPPTWFMNPVYTEAPELITLLYDGQGNLLWQHKHDSPNGTRAAGRTLAFDATNALYVAGNIADLDQSAYSNLIVLRYTPTCGSNGKVTLEGKNICTGGSVQLKATGGVSYTWTPAKGLSATNIANPVASPTTTTTYTVVVKNANGCTVTQQVTVKVSAKPQATLAKFADVCHSDAKFILTGGFPANGTYSGKGVSNGKFDPAVAGEGNHTITYTVSNGANCTSTVTQKIKVKKCNGKGTPNRGNSGSKNLTVYPNPTEGEFYINLPLPGKTDVTVQVMNPRGQIVLESKFKNVKDVFNQRFDITNKPKGAYFLIIITNYGVTNGKVVHK